MKIISKDVKRQLRHLYFIYFIPFTVINHEREQIYLMNEKLI